MSSPLDKKIIHGILSGKDLIPHNSSKLKPNIRKMVDGKKLGDSSFRGILNEAVRLRTKGKNPVDVQSAIDILKEKIDTLEKFQESRNKNV